jgi:hypothetical protein
MQGQLSSGPFALPWFLHPGIEGQSPGIMVHIPFGVVVFPLPTVSVILRMAVLIRRRQLSVLAFDDKVRAGIVHSVSPPLAEHGSRDRDFDRVSGALEDLRDRTLARDASGNADQ